MYENLVKQALREDIGRGSLYSLICPDGDARANIVCKEDAVFGGEILLREVCSVAGLACDVRVRDGQDVKNGQIIAEICGSKRALLEAERTMLNFIAHISGIATMTRRFTKELEGFKTVLLDTRKTHPGLRDIDKYAVRCGGGNNHRIGLDDCLLLQDAQLKGAGDIAELIARARKAIPFTAKIEIECDNMDDARKFMALDIDMLMCDHFSPEEISQIVAMRDATRPGLLLEATGNISVDTVRAYAATGVDAISTGSSIYRATWIDFSIKLI